MTAPITISPRTPGYGALMQTLVGNRPANGGAYAGRTVQQVRDEHARAATTITTIAAQQVAANDSKAGAS